jgi:hypothetical protein
MKYLIIILSLLLPFFLAYLIKNKDLNLIFISMIILMFSILVVSYLLKNNQTNQFSLKSFFFLREALKNNLS